MTVCSRPEDGLRCRLDVTPPPPHTHTHSNPEQYVIYISDEFRLKLEFELFKLIKSELRDPHRFINIPDDIYVCDICLGGVRMSIIFHYSSVLFIALHNIGP